MSLLGEARKRPKITVFGLASVVALGVAIPSINHAARWWLSHETAYAARDQAQETDEKFDRFIAQMEGYTQALQEQVQQRAVTNVSQPVALRREVWRERDEETMWCCDGHPDQCWEEQTWYRCE